MKSSLTTSDREDRFGSASTADLTWMISVLSPDSTRALRFLDPVSGRGSVGDGPTQHFGNSLRGGIDLYSEEDVPCQTL